MDIEFYQLEDRQPESALAITEVFGPSIRNLSYRGRVKPGILAESGQPLASTSSAL